ncbi:hypothetical protein KO361_00315 [Candidatus Woesearchaeota archaeon]|nr:hypothetical protein [Candidatus Woesearchaeota archaeon]
MVKQKDKSLDDKQLFSMLSLLKSCSDNEFDFSSIATYSLFEGLSKYKCARKNMSSEEAKFNEVKCVYSALEKNIEDCIEKGSSSVSLNLMLVEDILSNYASGEAIPKSALLKEIVSSNSFKRSEKNFGMYVEEKGSKLYRVVLDKGKFSGNRNILLNDYESISRVFM